MATLAEIAEPSNEICWPWPWERAAEAENGACYSRGSSRSTRYTTQPASRRDLASTLRPAANADRTARFGRAAH